MTNAKTSLCCATLGLSLIAVSPLVGQPAQAQLPLLRPINHRRVPRTPQQVAASEQQAALDRTAAASLHAGHYAQAEAEARQALSMGLDSGIANEMLGAALDGQGKEQEALQVYHAQVIDGKGGLGGQTCNLLPYALLLLKSGHWAQALAAYNRAVTSLPDVGRHTETVTVHDGDVIRANSHFSPDVPDPTALATAIHIARGLIYNASSDWAGEPQNTEALAEYAKALQLAPNSPLTNYYYGTGWQELSPAERAKVGSVQQAKAALQKAVLLGKGDVKKAALKALKGFNKPV